MKQVIFNRNLALVLGSILIIPTAYFVFISLLKYALGISFLFDSAQPLLEKLGINEKLGWNINLLILFGPLVALLLNLTAVLKVGVQNESDYFSLQVSVRKHWWNVLVSIFAAMLLVTLFLYLLGENCR